MEDTMSRSLIVLPDDSAKPILDAIDGGQEIDPRENVRVFGSGSCSER